MSSPSLKAKLDAIFNAHMEGELAGDLDPTGLPVTGAGAAAKLRNPALPDPFFNEG